GGAAKNDESEIYLATLRDGRATNAVRLTKNATAAHYTPAGGGRLLLAARGNEFQPGTPSPLFPARLPATTFGDLNFLAVSRDGSRFYIPQAVDQPDSGVIHVRVGWLKQ